MKAQINHSVNLSGNRGLSLKGTKDVLMTTVRIRNGEKRGLPPIIFNNSRYNPLILKDNIKLRLYYNIIIKMQPK